MYDDDRMIAAHLGDNYEAYQRALIPPIYMTSLHVFPTIADHVNHDKYSDFVYGRVSNPTVRVVEQKIAGLERGGYASVFSSGMAAATTAITVSCKAGSHIVCLRNCYGPVVTYLNDYCIPKYNMSVTYVEANADAVIDAIRPETSLILLESPTSAVFEVVDLRSIAKVARAKGILTYIDNTYCSPLYQKPLELGIDIVMHTLSKYLGGHSDLIGGVLVCDNAELAREITDAREIYGGILGPQEAWLVMRGIRTLDVRLRQHSETAMAVASFLEQHPRIKKVNYPGLASHPQHELAAQQQTASSGLLSFLLDGSREEAEAVCNKLGVFKIGVSWGGFESLVVMPFYKLSLEQAAYHGTEPHLIRIHCGLEGTENLVADLKQALAE